jgi:pimeloyl-ACP methyl ester carboxylesterase
MDAETLERDRLKLFHDHGFAARSLWLDDGDGRRTYAVVRGEGPCPTILVHGGIADASVWALLARHVEGPVVIPDRPGHGLSSPIDYTGRDYRAEAAEWLLRVADGLGAEQVNLVGNSMGGFFSVAFALAHPERVRRLVLAGAPAGLDRPIPGFLRAWSLPVVGSLVSAMIARTTDPEAMRTRVMADLCAHPERIPVEALRVAIGASAQPGFHGSVRSMLRACLDLGGWRPSLAIREPMASLRVPTLFVWGDRDSFAPPSSGQEIAARMPDARVHVLPGVGHLPQLDEPKALAAAFAPFLRAPQPGVAATA